MLVCWFCVDNFSMCFLVVVVDIAFAGDAFGGVAFVDVASIVVGDDVAAALAP